MGHEIIISIDTANNNTMSKLLLKLHKSSSSVDFIKKSLFNNIAPTFAKVKGKFINDNTKAIAEKEAMKNHPEAVVQRCSVKKCS